MMVATVDFTQGQGFFVPEAASRTYGPEDITDGKRREFEEKHGLKIQAIREVLAEAVRTLDSDMYLIVFDELLKLMQEGKAAMRRAIEKRTGRRIE